MAELEGVEAAVLVQVGVVKAEAARWVLQQEQEQPNPY